MTRPDNISPLSWASYHGMVRPLAISCCRALDNATHVCTDPVLRSVIWRSINASTAPLTESGFGAVTLTLRWMINAYINK